MALTYVRFRRQIDSVIVDKEVIVRIPIVKTIGILINRSGDIHSKHQRRTTTSKQKLGDYAESLAFDFLTNKGLKILECNFLCKVGEIDLVAIDQTREDPCLVFVEVRYRRSQSYGGGLESITINKQEKLRRAASTYLLQQGSLDIACRFDVISVSGAPKQAEIQWIKNAF